MAVSGTTAESGAAAASAEGEAENEQMQQGAMAYGHGSFQERIFYYGIVAVIVLMCHHRAFSFISPPVDHWCSPTKQFTNLSVAAWKNIAIPVDEADGYSTCLVYANPGHINDTTVYSCAKWDYDGSSKQQSVRTFWNLVCNRAWLVTLAEAVYMIGAVFVVPVTGYAADTMGRQPVIIGAVLGLVLSSAASCSAYSFVIYLVARFISSACASTVNMLTIILLFEIIPLELRTFYIGFVASLGVVMSDVYFLVLMPLRKHISWRLMQMVVVAPTILLLLGRSVIHESPIWLISMHRMRDAEAVMLKAARLNGARRDDAERSVEALIADLSRTGANLSISVWETIMSATIRVRVISVLFSNFTIMFAFFVITGSRLLQGQGIVKMVSVAVLVLGYLAMYLALNYFGRRKLLTVLLALLGGVSALCGVSIYAQQVEMSYVLLIAAKATASVLIPTNFLYIAELFPTTIRSAVLCGAYACGRVGGVLAACVAQLMYIGREDLGFAIAAFGALVNIVVVMQLPETSVGTEAIGEVKKRKDLLNMMQRSLAPLRRNDQRTRSKKALGGTTN
ncbi:solute carrier family 22 member 6-like [Rhipicephalus microplus]|uniref:solute carrier family 22 member 6-like n=1 Tax=Rhipicephalus microplus TaxID=6941 RepID=UPI003F6CD0CB